jgi:hypothetical protein
VKLRLNSSHLGKRRCLEPETLPNSNKQNADLNKVIETYAKASGQKFIIDPNAHGKITIINKDNVSNDLKIRFGRRGLEAIADVDIERWRSDVELSRKSAGHDGLDAELATGARSDGTG